MFMMVSTVYANDIYITQSGATLDLDVLQDGQNNTIGSSTTSSSVIGATTNFDIKQVGNSNVITFDINGANYTGTWDITGNSNNIDFNCDSTGNNSSCGTATANITWTGNSSDIDLDIGETSAAGNATVNITGASEINPDGNLDFSFDQTFVFFAVGGNSITVGCMDETAINYNAGAVVEFFILGCQVAVPHPTLSPHHIVFN